MRWLKGAREEDFWLHCKWFVEEEKAKKAESYSPCDAKVS